MVDVLNGQSWNHHIVKLIEAIIRPIKIDDVKEALSSIGNVFLPFYAQTNTGNSTNTAVVPLLHP